MNVDGGRQMVPSGKTFAAGVMNTRRQKLVACGADATAAVGHCLWAGFNPCGMVVAFRPELHTTARADGVQDGSGSVSRGPARVQRGHGGDGETDGEKGPDRGPGTGAAPSKGLLRRVLGWLSRRRKKGDVPGSPRYEPTSLTHLIPEGERVAPNTLVDPHPFLKDAELITIVTGWDQGSISAARELLSYKGLAETFVTWLILHPPLKTREDLSYLERRLYELRGYVELPLLMPFITAALPESIPLLTCELLRLITVPGMVNLDRADILTVVPPGDVGLGFVMDTDLEELHQFRARLQMAAFCDLRIFRRALMHVVCGEDLTVEESELMTREVLSALAPDARLIWGSTIVSSISGTARVLLITGGETGAVLNGILRG